jgi:uncharacterized protein
MKLVILLTEGFIGEGENRCSFNMSNFGLFYYLMFMLEFLKFYDKVEDNSVVWGVLKIKNMYLIALIVMTVVSFTNIFGLNIAGLSVIIGITFFIASRASEKRISSSDSLSVKELGSHLKEKSIWLWLLLPLIMNIICFLLATLFLPEFIEHLNGRTEVVVSINQMLLLILQLALLALGEEMAWRGFFQKQISKWLPIVPTLILTSIIFSLGHLTLGHFVVVSYDMFFIFINSVLYGVVFYKTNNAWISTISHFMANLFIIIVISFV